MVREFVRQVQEMRKKAGLKPQDKILIGCSGENSLVKTLFKNKNFILKEAKVKNLVLLEKTGQSFNPEKEIEIEGQKLLLAIKKI